VSVRLTALLAKVPKENEKKVKRTLEYTRAAIQESLRAESRLVLRTKDEAQKNKRGAQVPVEVSPGYPAIFDEISFPDDLNMIILLGRYRSILEHARTGVAGLITLRNELSHDPILEGYIHSGEDELRSTVQWASWLLDLLNKFDPVNRILAVEEDILGVYQYKYSKGYGDEYTINWAKISLYWAVIGLIAELRGYSIEDLTIVVLTHELAHAYTQLGADIEGRRWQADMFACAEKGLKEGLAQYYTCRVLKRMGHKFSGAIKVYESILPSQPAIYHSHLPWVETSSPEAVRRAMIEVRRWKRGSLEEFNRRLNEAHHELNPDGHYS